MLFDIAQKYDVIVIGGGPVGLTLGMDLSQRGIKTLLLEQGKKDDPAHPKCNTTSARSMEIFRRLGVSAAVRKAGLPGDYSCDVAYAGCFINNEYARLKIPSWSERYAEDSESFDGGWPTAEPPHRISQRYLEPVLREKAGAFEHLCIQYASKVTNVFQDESTVTVEVESELHGNIQVSASYAVGCDGSQSVVRKILGAKYCGDGDLRDTRTVFIKSDTLLEGRETSPSWMTWIINRQRSGNVVAIDGKELWLVHCHLWEGEAFDDVNVAESLKVMIGKECNYEILAIEDWTARRLVVDRYRHGNIFLAGDAAHLWIPFAGFGMNAGIEEAAHLAWVLAAVIHGWAADKLLDSYHIERRPIGEKVSLAAKALAESQRTIGLPTAFSGNTDEERAMQEAFRQRIIERDGPQFNPIGLNFASVYQDSPFIVYDDAEAPAFSIAEYTPATVPGCRLPHFMLNNGQSLYDALGDNFALIVGGKDLNAQAMLDAALEFSLPVKMIDITQEPIAPAVYDSLLVLARPDQRIAWRGSCAPANSRAIFKKILGYQSE